MDCGGGSGSGDDDLPDAGQAPSAGEDASPQPFTTHQSASSEGAASHAGGEVECSSAEDSDGGRARSGASSRYERLSSCSTCWLLREFELFICFFIWRVAYHHKIT